MFNFLSLCLSVVLFLSCSVLHLCGLIEYNSELMQGHEIENITSKKIEKPKGATVKLGDIFGLENCCQDESIVLLAREVKDEGITSFKYNIGSIHLERFEGNYSRILRRYQEFNPPIVVYENTYTDLVGIVKKLD